MHSFSLSIILWERASTKVCLSVKQVKRLVLPAGRNKSYRGTKEKRKSLSESNVIVVRKDASRSKRKKKHAPANLRASLRCRNIYALTFSALLAASSVRAHAHPIDGAFYRWKRKRKMRKTRLIRLARRTSASIFPDLRHGRRRGPTAAGIGRSKEQPGSQSMKKCHFWKFVPSVRFFFYFSFS